MYALYPGHRATGDVRLDGRKVFSRPSVDVAGLRYSRRNGIPEADPVSMTIFDNVAFGLQLEERVSRARAAERVESFVARCGDVG